MTDLYWITVLGNASDIIAVLLIIIGVAFAVTMVFVLIALTDGSLNHNFKRATSILGAVFGILLLLGIFIPNTTQLYAIYGIGGTIDYLRQNKEAQKLPDNIIKAANAYFEQYTDDNQSKQNHNK